MKYQNLICFKDNISKGVPFNTRWGGIFFGGEGAFFLYQRGGLNIF